MHRQAVESSADRAKKTKDLLRQLNELPSATRLIITIYSTGEMIEGNVEETFAKINTIPKGIEFSLTVNGLDAASAAALVKKHGAIRTEIQVDSLGDLATAKEALNDATLILKKASALQDELILMTAEEGMKIADLLGLSGFGGGIAEMRRAQVLQQRNKAVRASISAKLEQASKEARQKRLLAEEALKFLSIWEINNSQHAELTVVRKLIQDYQAIVAELLGIGADESKKDSNEDQVEAAAAAIAAKPANFAAKLVQAHSPIQKSSIKTKLNALTEVNKWFLRKNKDGSTAAMLDVDASISAIINPLLNALTILQPLGAVQSIELMQYKGTAKKAILINGINFDLLMKVDQLPGFQATKDRGSNFEFNA